MAGMILFLLVSSVVGGDLASLSFDLDLGQFITIGAVGYAVVGIIASQVVTKFIYKKTPMSGEAPTDQEIESAQMQYQTELIIRSALLEGAGFFCLIALMIDKNGWALIGAAACLFFLVLNLPRESPHLYDIQRRLTDRN